MADMTNYWEDEVLNALLRNTITAATANVYLALHTADPTETGAVAEVAAGWYARQAIAFSAPAGLVINNSGTVTFPAVTGAQVTITHVTIWDAVSTGNCFVYDALPSSVVVEIGEFFQSNASDHTITLSGAFSTYSGQAVLNHYFRNTTYTPVATVYASLHTADPGLTGASESTGGSYARQATAFDAPSGGATANTAEENFTSMPASTVTHFGVWDASTVGNFLLGAALDSSVSPAAGDTVRFIAGAMDILAQ